MFEKYTEKARRLLEQKHNLSGTIRPTVEVEDVEHVLARGTAIPAAEIRERAGKPEKSAKGAERARRSKSGRRQSS